MKTLHHGDTENTEKRIRATTLFVFAALSAILYSKSLFAADPPIVGRPADFSGAIGGPFVVTMNIEPTTVAVEEPFTLTLRIVGSGNLNEIARPPIGKLPAFKPFAVDDLDDSFAEGPPPSRTFRYRLRARSAEANQIPLFKFVYFNPAIMPASRGYQTTYAKGIEFSIKSRPVSGLADLAREVVEMRQRLDSDPDDHGARARLMQLRDIVPYPAPDMRPAEQTRFQWSSSARGGRMLAAWCLLLATTFVGWRRQRWRAYLIVAAAGTIVVGLISLGALLDWREETRNRSEPIIVVAKDTILHRGNGGDYPARVAGSLPPGAEVRRLCERHGWLQVELANGVVGWLPLNSVVQ
jgi:hypothetical protein